jgi:hypothetical protein
MTPGRMDLVVYRNAPRKITIEYPGIDWTGAVLAQQIRSYRGQPGSALITLGMAAAGTQGISLAVVTTLGVPTTTITLQYDEATIDALLPHATNGQEPNTDVLLKHDIIVTPSGGMKARWFEGDFTISEGVTV